MNQNLESDATCQTCVVTLIHGTFAANASWIEPEGLVAKQIRKVVSDPVHFSKFIWDGRNSPSSREAAVLELRLHQKGLLEEHPGCTRFIISHSHGGTIACGAAVGHNIADGIVCIGTPFIRAWVRPNTDLHWKIMTPFYFLGSFALLLGLLKGAVWPVLLPFVSLLLWATILGGTLPIVERWKSAAESFARKEVRSGYVPMTHVLVVRVPADEVTLAFHSMQFGSWLTRAGHGWAFLVAVSPLLLALLTIVILALLPAATIFIAFCIVDISEVVQQTEPRIAVF